ncbi:specifically androgen-regulated gene protein-like [Clinocottus analis]|uniref:specifically androgen-regulated gene protein-like n=1 Tax=Clinocottus analis TaxID=304258 RepID=UPI0035C09026
MFLSSVSQTSPILPSDSTLGRAQHSRQKDREALVIPSRPLPCAMPKSDTWPGGVAMQSSSNLDSAGSCDSVISVNSGYSQDSMEHLSPEERACLMYLEEMIEAMEVQEDSGLSNDEPDPPFQQGTGVNDVSSLNSDASGNDQTSEPGSRGLVIKEQAEHHALNQEPPMNPMAQPKTSLTESADFKIHPSASELCVSKNEDGRLQIVPIASLCPDPSNEASEIDVIPPPSDFMDEPSLPPHGPSFKYRSPAARLSNDKPGATVDLEQLRQRALAKRSSVNSSVTQNSPDQLRKLSLPVVSSDVLTRRPSEEPEELEEPRTPPHVAPKPKKLPANIILKSHKRAVSHDNSEHSLPANSDRALPDCQRVHMEALRKLGLLPADADSGPAPSPLLSPKSRTSWAGPLSPISPRAPHTPPFTPSYTSVNSSSPALVPFQSPAASTAPSTAPATAPAIQPAEVLPAPAAFSDPVGAPPSDDELSAVENASGATQVSTPPCTPPSPAKHRTPPEVVGVKSATLERSGLGLSDWVAHQASTEVAAAAAAAAGEQHKNKARPASLGSRNEFTSAGREGSPAGRATGREPKMRRSLPGHAGDAQKLPRSQGISVQFCPRAENVGERREALKKLGLLRD